MADLNEVALLGRLGADPEIRSMQNGEPCANLRIATGEKWKDKNTGEQKERTEWHSVVIFGPLAKVAEQYLKKGARVLIKGALRTRKWQDQQGNDRWSTEIVLTGFQGFMQIIDWPDDGGGRSRGQEDSYGGLPGASGSGSHGAAQTGGKSDFDDDIPF